MPEVGEGSMTSTARLPDFSDGVVRPAFLAHVVLNTNDIRRASGWYETVLGAQSTFATNGLKARDPQGNEHVVDLNFVTFDDEHHRVAFSNIGGKPEDPAPARTLNHIAFTYANIGDLVATYVRLKAEGITPVRTVHHGPTVSNYYLDPDGNRVELQVDAFASLAELNAWFASGAFDRNPIGIGFHFDAMVEAYEAGAEPAYLISNDGFIKDHAAKRG
jgi:catechol 2,3-dioxygenase-like lactoylglutathione lyase family enzyme